MRINSSLLFVAYLALSLTARADYVQVNRSASVYAGPNRSSDVVFKADADAKLLLMDSETENGYYHVQNQDSGQSGWIYRTFVRRYKGDISKTEHRPGTSFVGKGVTGGGFPENACKIPYNEEPSDTAAFDRSCGLVGDAKTGSGEAAQNPHKNNLCASGVAQGVAVSDLLELQKAVDDSGMEYGSPFRGKGPPVDRSKLQALPPVGNGLKLEEGGLVSFVGYLADAHYMPKSPVKPPKKGGETVNCHLTNHEQADIHLAISSSPGRISAKDLQKQAKFCKTISAEMIPHLRPSVWNKDNLDQVIDLERPIRIVGQLFFDGSHEPCEDGVAHKGDPQRATVWEIHPVYTFEVCKFNDLHHCDAAKSSDWQPLSQATGVSTKEVEEDE